MDPEQFDSVIAGLTELGARIAAVNARPFMPDPNMKLSRLKAKTQSLSQEKPFKAAGAFKRASRPPWKTVLHQVLAA